MGGRAGRAGVGLGPRRWRNGKWRSSCRQGQSLGGRLDPLLAADSRRYSREDHDAVVRDRPRRSRSATSSAGGCENERFRRTRSRDCRPTPEPRVRHRLQSHPCPSRAAFQGRQQHACPEDDDTVWATDAGLRSEPRQRSSTTYLSGANQESTPARPRDTIPHSVVRVRLPYRARLIERSRAWLSHARALASQPRRDLREVPSLSERSVR